MDEMNQNTEQAEAPLEATRAFAEDQGDLAAPVDIDNQSLDAIAASQQKESGPSPSFEDSPAHAETEPVQTAASGTDESSVHPSFNALDSALSDIEELEHDGFYEKIDEGHLKDLPVVARRILHNFRIDRKKQKESHNKEMQGLLTKVESRERRLAESEREFAKRQSEFASLVEDPEVQKILAEPQGEMPDVFTEQGVEARIQRGIARGMSAILEPMKVAADIKARENSYLDFVGSHPEMKDDGFKKEVVSLVRTRADVGTPVSTQDAYQLVLARRISAKHQIRTQHEQRARQQSARRVARAVSGGNPSDGEVPPDVQKQGAYAIASWLRANPEAARKISRSLR